MRSNRMKKSISWYQLWKRIGKQTMYKTQNTKAKVLIDGELKECALVFTNNGSDFHLEPVKTVKQVIDMDYISGTTMPPSYEEAYRKEYENKIRNKAIDDCIKILDTKEPKYYDVLNDRYDMIECLRELKKQKKCSMGGFMTEKEKLLEYIDKPVLTDARNSMGCSENWYNPYYAMKEIFTKEEIENMTDKEIDNLIKLAKNIMEALY